MLRELDFAPATEAFEKYRKIWKAANGWKRASTAAFAAIGAASVARLVSPLDASGVGIIEIGVYATLGVVLCLSELRHMTLMFRATQVYLSHIHNSLTTATAVHSFNVRQAATIRDLVAKLEAAGIQVDQVKHYGASPDEDTLTVL